LHDWQLRFYCLIVTSLLRNQNFTKFAQYNNEAKIMIFWSTVFVTAVVVLLPISLNAIKHDIVGKIKRTFSLPKQSSLGSMKNVVDFPILFLFWIYT
jgi:hypothetical protein